jgi:hypothetical protein
MGYNKLREHIKPIVERRLTVTERRGLLGSIGFEWERKKYLGQVNEDTESPFEYIKGEFSPYLAHAVYSYIWGAMTKKLKMIRLGPASLKVDERSDSRDDFSEIGELMIPYFLEAIRYDEILKEHLEFSQTNLMLVITINV